MMAIGLDAGSPELSFQRLVELFRDNLSPIVFSDHQITKMHDSLPLVLFRFTIILKLYEARELDWLAYFFPWAMLSEAMPHKVVATEDRVVWFRLAYCYLMKYMITSQDRCLGGGVKAFGRKGNRPKDRRILFGRKLLMHPTDTIVGLLHEMVHAERCISLRCISSVSVEKRVGMARMHAGVHHTMLTIIRTMENDEAMKFVYAQQEVKNRQLASGAIVSPCYS
jgi:hypothetical protein